MIGERERLPEGFLDRLIEYRRYAEAKRAIVDADVTPETKARLREIPLYAMAERIHFFLEGILSEV